MESKKYKIKGSFVRNGFVKVVSKVVSATNEKRALDKAYSLIGSNHKVKRRELKILEVTQLND